MPGMPMPEWYGEAKEQLENEDMSPKEMSFQPIELEKVDNLPHLFAEFELQGGNVLIHFFPRAGLEDTWNEGHYINRCQSCRSEVEMPRKPSELKPCPKCGHTGLVYIPGRVEEKSETVFPENGTDLVKKAVDSVWMGDVAIDFIPELGAYAVQLQSARNTAMVVGLRDFVEKICVSLNEVLSETH